MKIFSKTQKIQFKIILLFTIAILSTFIGEYLHDFFNDFDCNGSVYITIKAEENGMVGYDKVSGCTYLNISHSPRTHWGYRHWLYFTMCMILFVVQIADIIHFSSKE